MTITQHHEPGVYDATSPHPGISATELRRFMIWAGWSGLAASLAYLVTVLATSLLGSVEVYDGPADIVRYLREVADSPTRSWLYGVAGIVMSVLYLPFGVAVYLKLRRTALAGLGSVAMLVGLIALIPAYAISVLEIAVLAPASSEIGQSGSDSLFTVAEVAAGLQAISFTVGSVLTLGIAPLLWGLSARRTQALANWLARTGIVVGITGSVWFVWVFESPAVLAVVLVNVLASLVFFIGLSRALLSGESAAISIRDRTPSS